MNLIVLNGSPRTLGPTDRLTKAFLSYLEPTDKIKTYNLFDCMPTPCNACGYCKAADGCSKKDLEEFIGYYRDADAVLVATPVYNHSMPAPLKALFDRFNRFYEAKHKRNEEVFKKPKKAVLIVTSGEDGRIGNEVIRRQVEAAFESMNTTLTKTLLVSDNDSKNLSDTDLMNAKQLARYIY